MTGVSLESPTADAGFAWKTPNNIEALKRIDEIDLLEAKSEIRIRKSSTIFMDVPLHNSGPPTRFSDTSPSHSIWTHSLEPVTKALFRTGTNNRRGSSTHISAFGNISGT